MAGRDEEEIPVLQNEISELRTTINSLADHVTSLQENVASLTTDVKGLMATGDGGVYGESYADDRGPAVRALIFERDSQRLNACEEATATISVMAQDNLENMERIVANVLKFENELKDIRGGFGASVNGVPSARREKKGVTEMKGAREDESLYGRGLPVERLALQDDHLASPNQPALRVSVGQARQGRDRE